MIQDDPGRLNKTCLLTLGGLYLGAGKMSTNSYTIWIEFNTTINQGPVTGKVLSASNIEPWNLQRVANEVAHQPFHSRVDMELTLVPLERTQEATIDVAVGSQARSLVLPPLTPPTPPPPRGPQFPQILVGYYQVHLGPYGGCGGGRPNSYPSTLGSVRA